MLKIRFFYFFIFRSRKYNKWSKIPILNVLILWMEGIIPLLGEILIVMKKLLWRKWKITQEKKLWKKQQPQEKLCWLKVISFWKSLLFNRNTVFLWKRPIWVILWLNKQMLQWFRVRPFWRTKWQKEKKNNKKKTHWENLLKICHLINYTKQKEDKRQMKVLECTGS